jgi:signal transduction histidine kinase
MMGLTQLLARSNAIQGRERKMVDTLLTSSEHMLDLLNGLLDQAKIESGTIELEKVPFDLNQLLNDIDAILSAKAQEKSLAFEVTGMDAATQTYAGDPMRIKQIIMNLGSNAIKFTNAGSVKITLKTMPLHGKELMTINVIDTGIGMHEDTKNKVFQPYHQASASTARQYGGTGLGLSISRSLAELMGGTISVESEPGMGSNFTFSLLLDLAESKRAEAA